MKKFLISVVAAVSALTVVFSGCSIFKGKDGADGTNGKDLSIREIWETYKEETNNPDLTFEEFLNMYMPKIADGLKEETSLETAINYSLMSSVSIITTFDYSTEGYTKSYGGYNSIGSVSYQEVYVGSGVIVDMGDDYSYVVTNCHVIYSDSSTHPVCNDVKIYLYGQDTDGVNYEVNSYYVTHGLLSQEQVYYEYEEGLADKLVTTEVENDISGISATVVGASINYDIALLKVNTHDIRQKNAYAVAAEFDEADKSTVGETVYAIGFPGGEGMSVTRGVISKECDYSSYSLKDNPVSDGDYVDYRVLRTDAAINGGNSGGALYNSNGKIAGIVCSKKVGEDYDNLGYALPASNVKRLWKLMRDNQGSFNSSTKKPEVSRTNLNASYAVSSTSTYWNDTAKRAEYEEKVVLKSGVSSLSSGEVITHITIKNGETVIEDADVTRAYLIDDLMLSYRSGYSVYLTTATHTTPVKVMG